MTAPVVKLDKNSLMEWNNNKITDHNRSELSTDVNRIETPKRMANGSMRKYVIADKRTFSVSWSEVPHLKDYTVDGYWGGKEMETFYNTNAGVFTLKITNGDATVETFSVVFTSFSRDLSKRGLYDFWNVSVEMEEV